jgi:hypothetical protein
LNEVEGLNGLNLLNEVVYLRAAVERLERPEWASFAESAPTGSNKLVADSGPRGKKPSESQEATIAVSTRQSKASQGP